MKKSWKRIISVLILLGVLGAIMFVAAVSFGQEEQAPAEEKEYAYGVKTMAIEPGLTQTFTATGNVTVGQKSGQLAERRATVQEVYVKDGDTVAEGDVLVLLYSESLDSSYLNTQIMYANAQANVATTQAIANNQVQSERIRLETAELQLDNTLAQNDVQRKAAEEALNAAKLGSDLGVASAETALETAKKGYDKTKAIASANKLVAETGLMNAIRSLDTAIFSGLNTSNELFDVSSHYRGSAGLYKDLISTRSSQTKEDAIHALEQAITTYEAAESTYGSMKDAATAAELALDKTLRALNLTVPTGDLNQAVLTNFIATVTQNLSAVRSGISALESAKGSLDATLASNSANLTGASQQVQAAEAALAQAKQDAGGTSQAVKSAQAQYDVAMAQIRTAEDGARKALEAARIAYNNAQQSANLSVLGSKNALVSAQDAMDQINISRDKLLVRAPFNGRVADVPVTLGDEVNAGTVLVEIENPDTLKLEVQLGSDDVERVSRGDVVTFGEDGKVGTISAISLSADAVTRKYTVEIDTHGAELKPGQFVRVHFTDANVAESDNLFIPITAVLITSNETYVWRIEDGKTVKVPVELGNITGDHVEVLSGIDPGMEIIVEGGRIIEEEGTLVDVRS